MGEASRWFSYDEAAVILGMSREATRRLSLHGGWPRRAGPEGCAQVAFPDIPPSSSPSIDPEDTEGARPGSRARSLLDHLEAHVDRLTEELAEARTEMRGVRYEAESLRIEAARAQVLAALVEAERARSAEIRVERDKLVTELAEQRRPLVARVLRAVFDRQPARRRRPAF